jgi:hydrogenase maturation factor
MTKAVKIQQTVLEKLHQLPLERQQEVLVFVYSLQVTAPAKATMPLSLQEIAAFPIAERHRLLQPYVDAMAEDFRADLALTEFASLDGEDWEFEND